MEDNFFTNTPSDVQDYIQSSTFNSNSLTIIEISLILESICETLSTRDFANCRAVCRTWLSAFNSYFWKKIDWRRAAKNTTWDTIARNAFFIKDLTVMPWDIAFVGNNQLPNLSTLYIHRQLYKDEVEDHQGLSHIPRIQVTDNVKLDRDRFLSTIYKAGVNKNEASETISTLLLVKQNPRLEHLSIDITNWIFPLIFGSHNSPDYRDSRHQNEESIIHTLRNHPTLTSISVNYGSVGNLATISTIIRHCPSRTLQRLVITRVERLQNIGLDYTNLAHSNFELRDDDPWPLFPVLTSITVSYPITSSMMQVFIQLLKNCPNLKRFELLSVPFYQHNDIYDVITVYCPKLEEFPMPGYIVDYEVTSKFLGSMSKWRKIRLGIIDQKKDVIIPSILQKSWATIETFVIAGINNVSSKTVARILEECPNLKQIALGGYDNSQKCSITLSDLVFTPWASCEIRFMKIEITSSCPMNRDMNTPYSQKEIVDLLVKLVSKIERLKDPTMDYSWSKDFPIPLEEVISLANEEITVSQLGKIGLTRVGSLMGFTSAFRTMGRLLKVI